MNITPPKSQSPDLINFYGFTAYRPRQLFSVSKAMPMADLFAALNAGPYLRVVSEARTVFTRAGGGKWRCSGEGVTT